MIRTITVGFFVLFNMVGAWAQNCAPPFIRAGIDANNVGKYREAIKDFTIDLSRSIARLDSGDIYPALRDVDTAALLSPGDPSPYVIRGEIKDILFNYDKAVADYSISIRLKPENPRAFFGRGLAYFHLEKYNEAVTDLTMAIELKPDYGKAYWIRGKAKSLLKMTNFCEDYQKAAELHVPDAMETWLKSCQ